MEFIENQIQVLEDTQDQPTRFCFEFPLDVSLFQYFLSKGQQCLTYKQRSSFEWSFIGIPRCCIKSMNLFNTLSYKHLYSVWHSMLSIKKSQAEVGLYLLSLTILPVLKLGENIWRDCRTSIYLSRCESTTKTLQRPISLFCFQPIFKLFWVCLKNQ